MKLASKLLLCVGLCATILITIVMREHVVSAQSTPAVPAVSVPGMGIAFSAVGGAGADTAVLPNGADAVTRAHALDEAGKHALTAVDPRTIPGMLYNAQYGLFEDEQLHAVDASDHSVLQIGKRPAWVVTYYGPALSIALPGGRATMTEQDQPVAHQMTVVIDAATGQFLESYVG
jgi:hypothetical protein